MRFGMLGPLAVWTDAGTAVRVPEPKVRTLLAVLLTTPGRPVSVDRLIEALWGDRPPRNPTGTLQARISQLRGILDEAEPGGRALIVSRPPGYALDVAPDAVDAGRFAALLVQAREAADPLAKKRLLGDALAEWRGPAYADFADEEFARAAIDELEEKRLAALEDLAETRLELGEHVALAAELATPVARHPLRERLRAAHLRALYAPDGRARPSMATTTSANGWPTSWASTRVLNWRRSTGRCSNRTRRSNRTGRSNRNRWSTRRGARAPLRFRRPRSAS